MENPPSSADLRLVESGAAAPGAPSPSPPPPDAAPSTTPAKRRPVKARPARPLPTTRISFPRQLDVVRGWAIASGPEGNVVVSNSKVGEIVGMQSDTVTLANAFFADVDLIRKTDGGYVPSPHTLAYSQAYNWAPEEAAHKLAPPLSAAWFGQALLPRLSFAPLTEDHAIQALAEAAKASPEYRPQLELILDFMEAAGVILRDGGHVRVGPMGNAGSVQTTTEAPREATQPSSPQPVQRTAVTTAFTQTEGQIQFSVNFRLSMSEFAGWSSDRIAAFFNGIAQVLAAKADVEKEATE